MKAYVNTVKIGERGFITTRITGEYKSLETLVRYGVRPYLDENESVAVSVHYNWDTRYGKADKVFWIHA